MGVIKDELMVRIDPGRREDLLAKAGCRPMGFKGRRSRGFLLVAPSAIHDSAALSTWLEEGLSFNSRAKSYGKKQSAKRRSPHPA